ncbi:MAG: alginate lyase family protein [Deltaproteobacteria bacterium]|nr:alginate lyase family protein [Deltaproteobacteria bacterium]
MNPRSLPRLLRTLRHLRPRQALAQLGHVLRGGVRPVELSGAAPALRVEAAAQPFLPAPAHASFDGWRRFVLLGREHGFRDGVDWDFMDEGPLWAYHLHQFDYARSPSLSPQARWELMRDWIEHCGAGVGWHPHPISLRVLSWAKLLLTPGRLSLGAEDAELLRGSMACQVETLARNLELRLQGNHLFSNLLTVVFAGLLFEGRQADEWLRHEAAFRRELEEQILPDGSHIEGSPMYHGLLLENLLDLLNLMRALPERSPAPLLQAVEGCAGRMLGAHQVWTHPDGEIALLSDSAFGIAHPPHWLAAYGASLGVEVLEPSLPGVLSDAGVFRFESDDFALIATASAPAPTYQPGHAHCDALSFELSAGGQRVVTDTGVSEYIPGPLRDLCRATRSHATLELDGMEQSEIWAAHRVGGRARVGVHQVEANRRLEATCSAWATPRTLHRRVFLLDDQGLELRDSIEGPARPVRFALPLEPGVRVTLERDSEASRPPGSQRAWVELPGDRRLRIDLPKGVSWRLESRPYFPRFGARIERSCLVGEAEEFREGRWYFSLERKRVSRSEPEGQGRPRSRSRGRSRVRGGLGRTA